MKKVILSAVLLLQGCSLTTLTMEHSTGVAAETDWQLIGENKQEDQYFIGKDSSQIDDEVTFRSRVVFAKPQQQLNPTQSITAFSEVIHTWQMNCQQKTYKVIASQFLDIDAQVVYAGEHNNVAAQKIGQTDTLAQRQYQIVCENQH